MKMSSINIQQQCTHFLSSQIKKLTKDLLHIINHKYYATFQKSLMESARNPIDKHDFYLSPPPPPQKLLS